MTLLDLIVRTPVSEALGWTLFHSLWEGAAHCGGVRRTTRRGSLATHPICGRVYRIARDDGELCCYFDSFSARERQRRANACEGDASAVASAGRGERGQRPFSEFRHLSPVARSAVAGGRLPFLPALRQRLAVSARLRSRGTCKAPELWQLSMGRLAAELKISRPVVLLESLLADTPVVLGHLRPVVLVPLGFLAGLPPDYVEAVLLHELAHIGRCDYLVKVCQRAMEGLLFYHPAVWWISRVVRVERENCCDDVVVALRGDAHGYAEALATLEQNRLEQQWPRTRASAGRH